MPLLHRRLTMLACPLYASLTLVGSLLIGRSPALRPAPAPDFAAMNGEEAPLPPLPFLDPGRICIARQECRYLRRINSARAASRTVAECRHWQALAASARADYRAEYLTITPAGRQRSHLDPPDGP